MSTTALPMTGPPSVGLAFRPDIAGLRAVAVGIVVLFHAGVPWLPGGYVGVDIFFVISGFLMTSLLMKEIDQTGRVRLLAFYARRIRRLLPAAAVVLVTTVIAAKILLSPLELPDIAKAGAATGLYVVNMWFAVTGTDYLASEAQSPQQHYWSLAVEEQFYLAWPLFLLLSCVLRYRWRVSVAWSVTILSIISLALCIWLTSVSQPWAFFSLLTRAWELGAGGLIALAAHRLHRIPPTWAHAISWTGLLMIVITAATYTKGTAFPGWAALVPVAGAMAILGGGVSGTAGGASRVLQLACMQRGGELSYSLYLWHWPVFIVPIATFGELGGWTRAGLIVVTVALAWATYTLVENPLRRSPRLRNRPSATYALGATLTAISVGAAALVGVPPKLMTNVQVEPLTSVRLAEGVVGAAGVVPANVAPALNRVTDDIPVVYGRGCHASFAATTSPECVFGIRDAPRSMVLMGDSHAAQWFPALERMAIEDGWRLTSLTKSACPPYDVAVRNLKLNRAYQECGQWRAKMVARIQAERPDIVVLSAYSQYYRTLIAADENFLPSWSSGITRLISQFPAGTRVMIIGDTPTWPTPPVNCLSAHLDDPAACSAATSDLVAKDIYVTEAAAAAASSATFVPTVGWLCTDRCDPLAANVVVYRDRHHVTATFAGLLSDRFRQAINTASR
jgi:peptidoglycan/LPS O-acetylase OafA/YrhL